MIQVYNVLFRKLCKKIKKNINEIFFVIINTVLGLVGYYLATKGLNTGWWLVLVRMLVFLPFFEYGTYYKKFLEKYDRLPNEIYFSIILIAKIIIFLIIKKAPDGYTYSWCNDFNNGIILPIISGILAITFWLRIAKIIEPILKDNKYINIIAENSYSIMINQFMGFMIVKTFFACLNKFFGLCKSFNWNLYKTNIGYRFMPYNIKQTLILYFVAGIVVPIIMSLILKYIKKYINIVVKHSFEKMKKFHCN